MDGFRSDYLSRTELPFFARLLKEGAYSTRFRPVFPPITFPSHCAEATGVSVEHHGITGNSFYDTATRSSYHYPADASVLQAEPIWLTAARQGVRTLVFDWPLSQKEHGAVQADYSEETFDNTLSDQARLDHLLSVWHEDEAKTVAGTGSKGKPLRLLMGYVEATDPPGHKFGPDAPEITRALQDLDGALGAFAERALAQWKEQAGPKDRFYLLLTTDHGMSRVDHEVNADMILGLPAGEHEIEVEPVGNLANVYLDQIPAGAAREARTAALLAALHAYPFARAYRRTDLPAAWEYAHPTRTGDIVIVLPKGYAFNKLARQPVVDAAVTNGPLGMHGYPVGDDPEMYGVTLLWRYPDLLGGKDLGEVNWSQYHPTVARLLGIQPAAGAKGKPIALPGE
jgi:predicted AlkP superfamily pyrophosphatase or phosphodiesterase